jgi:hypothetical protein
MRNQQSNAQGVFLVLFAIFAIWGSAGEGNLSLLTLALLFFLMSFWGVEGVLPAQVFAAAGLALSISRYFYIGGPVVGLVAILAVVLLGLLLRAIAKGTVRTPVMIAC